MFFITLTSCSRTRLDSIHKRHQLQLLEQHQGLLHRTRPQSLQAR
jgi:hypothetical protein